MHINLEFDEFSQAFSIVLPYLKEIMGQDLAVNISDRTHFQSFADAATFHVPVKPGDEIPQGDPTRQAIKQGEQLMANVPAEVYGVPMKAVMTPIISDGNVVGCIGIARSRALEVEVIEMATNLDDSLQQASAAIQQIAASAGSVNENQQQLGAAVTQISEVTSRIHAVSELIKDIANQTNLLGLNASIEAARAGDAGRGFGVVAEEIRKLSDESQRAVTQIKDLAKQIDERIQAAKHLSSITTNASEEQAAAAQEITASIEDINSSAQLLGNIANNL